MSWSVLNTKQIKNLYLLSHSLTWQHNILYTEHAVDQYFKYLTFISVSLYFYQRPLQAVKITEGDLPATNTPHWAVSPINLRTITYKFLTIYCPFIKGFLRNSIKTLILSRNVKVRAVEGGRVNMSIQLSTFFERTVHNKIYINPYIESMNSSEGGKKYIRTSWHIKIDFQIWWNSQTHEINLRIYIFQ